jgi:archaellum component FlaF (FlaF/FlaG flagellin family)
MTNPAERDDNEGLKFDEVNGEIYVRVLSSSILNGLESADNSFMGTSEIDEVFLGEWVDTINYNNLIVGVSSTQDSATDGFIIQWSQDGVSVHDTDTFSILANNGKVFTFCPARRYIFSGASQIPQKIPFRIPEKVDIEARVNTPGSAGVTSVGSAFELWYENN